MSPQATVRAQARAALKGNYVKAVSAFTIALLPMYIIAGAEAVLVYGMGFFIEAQDKAELYGELALIPAAVITVILISPLINGYVRQFYRNGYSGQMDMNDLFYYFENGRYGQTLRLNLSLILRLLLPAVVFYLPVIAFVTLVNLTGKPFADTVLYQDGLFILSALSLIVLTLYSTKYFTVLTMRVENESMSNRELIKTAKGVMKHQTGQAAKLIFSYFPWILLCLTILPMFYVAPYMTQGLCIGAKWMTKAAFERR